MVAKLLGLGRKSWPPATPFLDLKIIDTFVQSTSRRSLPGELPMREGKDLCLSLLASADILFFGDIKALFCCVGPFPPLLRKRFMVCAIVRVSPSGVRAPDKRDANDFE